MRATWAEHATSDVTRVLTSRATQDGSERTQSLLLVPNPSHLEAVTPVVLGMVRGAQQLRQDQGSTTDEAEARRSIAAVVVHGDAAFAGLGLAAESLQLANVPGRALASRCAAQLVQCVRLCASKHVAYYSYCCLRCVAAAMHPGDRLALHLQPFWCPDESHTYAHAPSCRPFRCDGCAEILKVPCCLQGTQQEAPSTS